MGKSSGSSTKISMGNCF